MCPNVFDTRCRCLGARRSWHAFYSGISKRLPHRLAKSDGLYRFTVALDHAVFSRLLLVWDTIKWSLGNRLLVFGSATVGLESHSGILDARRQLCTGIPCSFSPRRSSRFPTADVSSSLFLDSAGALSSEHDRRPSNDVADELTGLLNLAHRIIPALRLPGSANLGRGSLKTLAAMARP